MSQDISHREKVNAILQVARFRPLLTIGVIGLSVMTALLEGIGIGFILPIIEQSQSPGSGAENGLLGLFATAYQYLGIPFSLESLILGVVVVMTIRFTGSFLVIWLQAKIHTEYVRYLQTEAFENALAAEVSYFDERGSDEILNAIVTQAVEAGNVIRSGVRIIEQGLISLVYLSIALVLAPMLTIGTAIVLGSAMYLLRSRFESGYSVGERVATANEQIQEAVQAGTQGIRDVKLFGVADELFSGFRKAINQFAESHVKLQRNKAAITNFYQLLTAISVFVLIYVAITYTSLSIGGLGLFLFAIFRLGPKLSMLNNVIYDVEGYLPHLVRTQQFVEELETYREGVTSATEPDEVDNVAFEEVSFSYEDENVLQDISFSVERGEFVGFVGQSGAGKSTIVSLLVQMYAPDTGRITADGTPIDEFDINSWRKRVAIVRQDPFIFNDTLRNNITLGNRSASKEEIRRVCEISQVTEFLSELPNGLDTPLGDDGVRLSGGQRQRVALARALLKDADVLVLDEATSDLDMSIEKKVQQEIESMDRDYAILAIAHRLSTVVNADRIYTLEDGQIMERGPHDELIKQDGKYNELYAAQR